MKPKLLYAITRSNLGGAQGNLLNLLKVFSVDFELHLAVGEEGALTDEASQLGLPIHIIPNLTRKIQLLGDLRGIYQFVNLIRKLKPDLIHAHSSKAGLIARISGKLCNVPTVFTAHGWGFSPGTPRLRRIIALFAERFLAQISSKIICVSDSDLQQALRKGVGNKNVLITIRHGISDRAFLQPSLLKQPLRLIMVARFNEQKDQETLLRAISEIPSFLGHVDFVGSGPTLEYCNSIANNLGISDRVSFLGDRLDVTDLLSRSQIFILATHYEGLPISILEAMRSGLPIIASDVNGIPEEIDQNVTGLLVPPRDVTALANAIRVLTESPKLRQTMGAASRQKFEREFTINRMIQETREVYHKLISENHSKA